jgi:7-cyano-7-deazaguanine synthase
VKARKEGQERPVAVLCSGGLDSAVLVADQARDARVHPVYVRAGLAWESREQDILTRLLAAAPFANRVEPLTHLEATVRDLYAPTHWAFQGTPPAFETPDHDVYLVGRNVTLLAKVGLFCAQRDIGGIALASLAANPFPDATPTFFDTMARALSLGLDHDMQIDSPFSNLTKADVIRLGLELGVPFGLTLSCMDPADARHCGRCSKCRERLQAFAAAGVTDPAEYAGDRRSNESDG